MDKDFWPICQQWFKFNSNCLYNNEGGESKIYLYSSLIISLASSSLVSNLSGVRPFNNFSILAKPQLLSLGSTQ